MFSFKNPKKIISIFIEDHILRLAETTGNNVSSAKLLKEIVLPAGLISNGRITDEITFYQFIKDAVKKHGIKNRHVYFNVPNSMVVMRQVEVPGTVREKNDIQEYISSEIGNSIHLPFANPIIDVMLKENGDIENYPAENRQVSFFAAPGEELRKYTEIFADASLKPIAADVGILGDYRYFLQSHSYEQQSVYLIVEFNTTSVHLGIFHNHVLEFLRYQDLDVALTTEQPDKEVAEYVWKYASEDAYVKGLMQDQINELDKIMNFYRFSLHKGEKQVTDIVILGDYDHLDEVHTAITSTFEGLNVIRLEGDHVKNPDGKLSSAFIPVLGLALRGGKNHASRS